MQYKFRKKMASSSIIPVASTLPEEVDYSNLIRKKIAKEIQKVSSSQKHVHVKFKTDPLYTVDEGFQICIDIPWMAIMDEQVVYRKLSWDMEMFEKVAEECRDLGYRNVDVKKEYMDVGSGKFGATIVSHILFSLEWGNPK